MRMMPVTKGPRPSSRQRDSESRGSNSYEAPTRQPRVKINDFDSAVREEMNRLELKLKSMIPDSGPSSSSQQGRNADRGSTSANSNAYRNGQHSSQPSELQIGFGTDPATERALKKAKQVEYKRQLDSYGNNKKGSNGRMKNGGQSPLIKLSHSSDRGDNNDGDLTYSNGYGSPEHFDHQPQYQHRDSFDNASPSKSSPTQARLRLVSDVYGASAVIVDPHLSSPGGWKGQGEEMDRKRLAAMEHKRALDDQIAQDRRRKELEKDKDRQSDDRAMQLMIRKHEDDRERERIARDALRLAMKKDAARVSSQEKFNEDAMARHNKNTKTKPPNPKNRPITPGQGEMTPRGGGREMITPRKELRTPNKNKAAPSPLGARPNGRSPAGSGLQAVLDSRNGGQAKKQSALDYQRALDEQLFQERRRLEEAKIKESEDELAFLRALRGESEAKPHNDFYPDLGSPNSQFKRCDREFEPSMDSVDMMAKTTDGLQNMMKFDRPGGDEATYAPMGAGNQPYTALESLPFAMGGDAPDSPDRFLNNPGRRAATPGGALECETHMTDENTMMFLQRPYTPSDSDRFAPASGGEVFMAQYDSNGNYINAQPAPTQGRKKSITHPDYEQYEGEPSLSYSNKTAADPAGEPNANDTSFVSDSQLVHVPEHGAPSVGQKKLESEMSMASESLLMYVSDGSKSQKFKDKFSKKIKADDASKSMEQLPSEALKSLSVTASPKRPSTTGSPAPASPAPGLVSPALPVVAPIHSRIISRNVSPGREGNFSSPNYDGSDSDSDAGDASTCKWCFGDYYPCRCAEKGRNTAEVAQKSSPPNPVISASGVPHLSRSQSAAMLRLSVVRPPEGVPCKWCLDTFVPCFCEVGIPGAPGEQSDNEPSQYFEGGGYNGGRRGSQFVAPPRRSSVAMDDRPPRRSSVVNVDVVHSRAPSERSRGASVSRKNSYMAISEKLQ